MLRHALGALGVCAAGVLLAVSAAMNWKFGYSLGRTDLDGQILGAASAAADCFKALIPFFFFAAVRNRVWSQAAAAAVVWAVVTAYSLTSALGHAALNRADTAGQRAVGAQAHADARADLDRAKSQLSWVPQHRPAATVQGELDSLKTRREWTSSNQCTDVRTRAGRDFCQEFHGLTAELASAQQAAVLETRISEIQSRIASATGKGAVMSDSDPQVKVIGDLTGLSREAIVMSLTVLVALLLEVGSSFGMYVAFATWRIHDQRAPLAPSMASLQTPARPVETAVPALPKARSSANDNRSVPKLVAPETDVERFYKERIETQEGSSLTATALYEDYCAWCEEQQKEPLALPTFGREFGELGVQKAKIAGRVRYIAIALKSGQELEEVKNLPALSTQAA